MTKKVGKVGENGMRIEKNKWWNREKMIKPGAG